MDEIKSISFHIMLYRLFRGVAKYIVTVILFHHLDDCYLYTPPRGVKGRQNQVQERLYCPGPVLPIGDFVTKFSYFLIVAAATFIDFFATRSYFSYI